jgi:hypothetical protein
MRARLTLILLQSEIYNRHTRSLPLPVPFAPLSEHAAEFRGAGIVAGEDLLQVGRAEVA